jgi:hypothetical protein
MYAVFLQNEMPDSSSSNAIADVLPEWHSPRI